VNQRWPSELQSAWQVLHLREIQRASPEVLGLSPEGASAGVTGTAQQKNAFFVLNIIKASGN
jgi:hypothetical protein